MSCDQRVPEEITAVYVSGMPDVCLVFREFQKKLLLCMLVECLRYRKSKGDRLAVWSFSKISNMSVNNESFSSFKVTTFVNIYIVFIILSVCYLYKRDTTVTPYVSFDCKYLHF